MTTVETPDAAEEAARARKKTYKKSLNLPRTGFAMRANLRQNEPTSLKRWQQMDLFTKVVANGDDQSAFAFHDGPPYANGDIHTGHLMNKVLKDIVVRSRNLLGQTCAYVPGWDCHGLPIEHKVLAEMIASGKAAKLETLEPDTRRMAIRRACKAYAEKYKKLQAKQMERLLTLANYDDPYLTMTPDFEQAVLEVLALLIEQGIVYRDLKPVHWSIANQTALAEAELEYQDRNDPSVYVRFAVADRSALAQAFSVEEQILAGGSSAPGDGVDADAVGPSLLIWTTTPWTLPANMLIALHPEHRYALVRLGDQAPMVIASSLVERVASEVGVPTCVLAETTGERLAGLAYHHPMREWSALRLPDGSTHHGRTVLADYVTLEDGTGLVHTATGHGQEDYQTGQREDVAVYCPVQGDGTYDGSVPDWLQGKSVWEANPEIVDFLRASGHLVHHADYHHSYPHDWRSKTPVIFRCTEQWFVAVDKPTRRDQRSLREMALDAVRDDVTFVPAWGENRMRGMVDSRPDWCISRQRAWGLPIPAFRQPDGTVLLTAATVRAVSDAFAKEGSDAWFTRTPAELLASWDAEQDPEALSAVAVDTLEKMYDIVDVWFESGSSWNAVMRARDLGYPVDLYLEGSDQHRGWFQSSMLLGLGATGQAPMTTIMTHGFIVDKDGKKMSKSLGNTLDVEELLNDFGADVCRWWVSSLAFENECKVDISYFDVTGDSYRKVRNTLRYLLSNLSDHDPAQHAVALDSIPSTSLDGYVVAATADLRRRVVDAYQRYALRQAHLALFDFCNDTLSALYLDAMKDRLYCDRPDSPRRRRTQTAMAQATEVLITLLAPILPHTADEAWRALHGDETGSVHLGRIPELTFDADSGWPRVLEAREEVQKALEGAKTGGIENPLDAGVVIPDPEGVLAPFEADLADVFGVSRVTIDPQASSIAVQDLRQHPRCERSWRRDPTVAERADGGWLSDRDAEAVGVS